MTLLVGGILLWWAGHFFKRILPEMRASLGDPGKGIAAVIILAGVVLMVIGYRGMDFIPVYEPPRWAWHANNLLMLISVILFGTGSSKSSLRRYLRHPMLMGVIVWAVAHLLVNGDLAALLLFGSMIAWGVVEMLVINAKEPEYEPWVGGSIAGTLRLLVISAVVYVVIGAIHTWLGYWPFP